jgi:Kef-type K+ transport system membrane component KefB
MNDVTSFLHDLVTLPTLAKFAIGMAIIVGVPMLCRRVHLPPVVGLLLSGVIVGPHVIGIAGAHHPIADAFSELGKVMLMFIAGLEIDLNRFRQSMRRTFAFGIVTTSLPLILGTAVGFFFGYSAIPAIVLGSLLASHTLLGAPIITQLGANRLEPMAVTYGATVISDTLSLVVFAVCVSTFVSGFSVEGLTVQLVEIAVFIPFILIGMGRFSFYALGKIGDDEDAHFVLMLLIIMVAGVLASVINLPDIVGAFLAGLAVNGAFRENRAKEKLEFFAKSFFVPIFFIVTGFLIDPVTFAQSIVDNFPLVVGVIGALLIGKYVAAQSIGLAFGYSAAARMTMWSLTLPQVAATLAAALVAFNTLNPEHQRLVDSDLLHVVLVLMLTTAILGPTLTAQFAPRMLAEDRATAEPVRQAARRVG